MSTDFVRMRLLSHLTVEELLASQMQGDELDSLAKLIRMNVAFKRFVLQTHGDRGGSCAVCGVAYPCREIESLIEMYRKS